MLSNQKSRYFTENVHQTKSSRVPKLKQTTLLREICLDYILSVQKKNKLRMNGFIEKCGNMSQCCS